MSKQNVDKGEHSGRSEISSEVSGSLEMNVNDFIEYSDSVDERMMELVENRKEPRETNPNKMNWDRREYEYDSDSDEEQFPSNDTKKCSTAGDDEENLEMEMKADSSSHGNTNIHRARNQQDVTEEPNTKDVNAFLEEFVKKFSTIVHLRQKENLRKAHENKSFKPCIPEKAHQSSEGNLKSMCPEDFLGCRHLGRKSPTSLEKKEGSHADLDEIVSVGEEREEADDEIDKIVSMLSSSAIRESNVYDDYIQENDPEENREKHLNSLNKELDSSTDSEIDFLESSKDIAPQETSQKQSLDDTLFDWKAETSKDLRAIFDGYEIDNLSSFHDWMVDDMLSKSLNSSYDSVNNICAVCFSCHASDEECVRD